MYRAEVKPGQVMAQKYILLKLGNDRTFPVTVPALDAWDAVANLTPGERLTVGQDEVVVYGDVKDLTRVTFNGGGNITLVKAADNKSVRLKGLAAQVTTTVGLKKLVFLLMLGCNNKQVQQSPSGQQPKPSSASAKLQGKTPTYFKRPGVVLMRLRR